LGKEGYKKDDPEGRPYLEVRHSWVCSDTRVLDIRTVQHGADRTFNWERLGRLIHAWRVGPVGSADLGPAELLFSNHDAENRLDAAIVIGRRKAQGTEVSVIGRIAEINFSGSEKNVKRQLALGSP
jgi:N-methylhydantoinase A/oxoprolinase/acetone carboxylase beta subunit